MVEKRNRKLSFVLLGCALAAAGAVSVVGCDDDGVTPDCPAMPIVDENGQPVGKTKWSNPDLGPGGALNRWQVAAAKDGCATLPQGGASN